MDYGKSTKMNKDFYQNWTAHYETFELEECTQYLPYHKTPVHYYMWKMFSHLCKNICHFLIFDSLLFQHKLYVKRIATSFQLLTLESKLFTEPFCTMYCIKTRSTGMSH